MTRSAPTNGTINVERNPAASASIAQRIRRPRSQIGDLQWRATGDGVAQRGDGFRDTRVAHRLRTIASL